MMYHEFSRTAYFCSQNCRNNFSPSTKYYVPTIIASCQFNMYNPPEVSAREAIEFAKEHDIPFLECDLKGKVIKKSI